MKKQLFAKMAAVNAFALLAAANVHAALPEGASAAIDGYKTDATTAIGLIMAAGVTIWGLLKLASKLGWR
ncbi:hypothetical protein [Variovorax durovernensis]